MTNGKARRQAKLATEKAAIERRLEDAVAINPDGPLLGQANITYELAERTKGISHGGMGMIAKVVKHSGLAEEIDSALHLLKIHRPYHESDHVLNVAYNSLCGGRTLDDIEHRRNDAVFLDALGVASLPDPTTAGDFCRRFEESHIMDLQEAINAARLRVWSTQPASFFDQVVHFGDSGHPFRLKADSVSGESGQLLPVTCVGGGALVRCSVMWSGDVDAPPGHKRSQTGPCVFSRFCVIFASRPAAGRF